MKLAIMSFLILASVAARGGDNTLSVIGGYGPTGTSSAQYEPLPSKNRNPYATENHGAVYGVQYQHNLEPIVLGVQVLSNGSYMGSAGINF